MIAIHAVGIIALIAMASNAPPCFDAAVVTAVLGFVGTMMFARYMENLIQRIGSRTRNRLA